MRMGVEGPATRAGEGMTASSIAPDFHGPTGGLLRVPVRAVVCASSVDSALIALEGGAETSLPRPCSGGRSVEWCGCSVFGDLGDAIDACEYGDDRHATFDDGVEGESLFAGVEVVAVALDDVDGVIDGDVECDDVDDLGCE